MDTFINVFLNINPIIKTMKSKYKLLFVNKLLNIYKKRKNGNVGDNNKFDTAWYFI